MLVPIYALIPIADIRPSRDYDDANEIDRPDFLVSVLRQITVRPSLSAPEDNRSRWTPRRSS